MKETWRRRPSSTVRLEATPSGWEPQTLPVRGPGCGMTGLQCPGPTGTVASRSSTPPAGTVWPGWAAGGGGEIWAVTTTDTQSVQSRYKPVEITIITRSKLLEGELGGS